MKAQQQFRQNLRLWMNANSITQRHLAEVAGVGYPYLNRVLKGEVSPSLSKCDDLATAAGLQLVDCLVSPIQFEKMMNLKIPA